MHTVITNLHKVIILQYILDGVIRVQQTQTLAPADDKPSVLHSSDAAVVWFVLRVTFQSLVSEPPDGVGGVPARHRQPLISDVNCETRHRASAALCCSERCSCSAGHHIQPPAARPPITRTARGPRLAGDTPLTTGRSHGCLDGLTQMLYTLTASWQVDYVLLEL